MFHDDSDDVSSCSEYDSEDICSLGSVPTMAESMSQQTSDIAGVNGGMDVDSPVGPACSCPIHGNREMNGRGGQLVSSDVDDDASSPLITTSLQVGIDCFPFYIDLNICTWHRPMFNSLLFGQLSETIINSRPQPFNGYYLGALFFTVQRI